MHFFDAISDKFALYLMHIIFKNGARFAPSYDSIWDESIEHHQHQSTK